MLPDIPKTKAQIGRQLRRRIRDIHRAKNPLAALGMSITQHEGLLHSYEQVGAGIVEEGFREYSVPVEIRFDEIPDLVGDRLIAKIETIGEELARQTSKDGFKKIEEELSKVGNFVNAAGRPVSEEVFFEMLHKMDMSFDDNGNPDITFIVHPDMGEHLRRLSEEWKSDAKFNERYKELMRVKREAWLDRENHRKLVD